MIAGSGWAAGYGREGEAELMSTKQAGYRPNWRVFLLVSLLSLSRIFSGGAQTQDSLLPCQERPLQVERNNTIWVDPARWCLEQVIALPPHESEEFAWTALAFGDDAALYATAPLKGEIWRFTDGDGDGLADAETGAVILRGLRRPNTLAWHEGRLYIVAGAQLLTWKEGKTQTLLDDLPTGGGFWNGGLAFDDENQLYIGLGAPCTTRIALCEIEQEEAAVRGSVLRLGDDGQRSVYATGLRRPIGLAWAAGSLWAIDTNEPGKADELNRVIANGDYSAPVCDDDAMGTTTEEENPCTGGLPPALALPAGSWPVDIAVYEGAAFAELTGNLLLALAGNRRAPLGEAGFSLATVPLDASGAPLTLEYLVPQTQRHFQPTRAQMAILDVGIWPRQILGIAVDPNGWIFFSISGGQIYALRPNAPS